MPLASRFYTAATGPTEWWQPHAPVWKAVGRYARWHPDVIREADNYIRSTLGIEDGVRTPEVIASLTANGKLLMLVLGFE